jgi:DNA-directed RNA polymerase subunit M/transcription elongation factor TFIIS
MDSASPSMVHRNGDTIIVRRVVSGDQVVLDQRGQPIQDGSSGLDLRKEPKESKKADNQQFPVSLYPSPISLPPALVAAFQLSAANSLKINQNLQQDRPDYDQDIAGDKSDTEANLPQCKIKRNYSCNNCSFFTQNPRKFLVHLRDVHGEKIVINECKFCLYASRHYQKLVRHMKMVHGSTEGINEPGHFRRREKRRRMSADARQKNSMPAFPTSTNTVNDLTAINQMLQLQNQLHMQLQAQLQYHQQESQPHDMPSDDEADMTVTLSPNGTKVFKCILCEFSTVEESQLIQHEKEEHSDTKFYRCEKCSYVTHIKARFSKHVKYHSMPMIKCMLCDFRTPVRGCCATSPAIFFNLFRPFHYSTNGILIVT